MHTRHSGRIPAAKGMVAGARNCTAVHHASGTHTHSNLRPPDPQGEGDAHLHSSAPRVSQSGTHTHRAYETALHTEFAHIRYALTSYFSSCCHTPPRSSASSGRAFVWEERSSWCGGSSCRPNAQRSSFGWAARRATYYVRLAKMGFRPAALGPRLQRVLHV